MMRYINFPKEFFISFFLCKGNLGFANCQKFCQKGLNAIVRNFVESFYGDMIQINLLLPLNLIKIKLKINGYIRGHKRDCKKESTIGGNDEMSCFNDGFNYFVFETVQEG